MLPSALAAMAEQMALTGNPSSLHTAGRAARRVVEESRERLARAVGARPSEVVFTSGGTEADNLAVKGAFAARREEHPARHRLVVSAIEHHAVLDCVDHLVAHEGAKVTWVEPDAEGLVTPAAVRGRHRGGPRGCRSRQRHVGQQRGGHGPAGGRDRPRGPRVRDPRPHRRGAGPGAGAGRLRRQRRRPDDDHRSQGRRPARGGRPPRQAQHAGGTAVPTAVARSGRSAAAPSMPRRSGASRWQSEEAVRREAEESARVLALRDRLITSALALDYGITVTGFWERRRRHTAPAGQRAPAGAGLRGRLAALPARRCRRGVLHRLGLPGRGAAAQPRAAGHGDRGAGRPGRAAPHPRATPPPTPTSTRSSPRCRPLSSGPGAPRRTSGAAGLMRVVAAMSGGVDSAVAAARDARRRPRGGRASTWRCRRVGRDAARERPRLLHDRGRRRRAPGRRRARHPVLRLGHGRPVQATTSVEDFVAEYAAGRTPNPCLRCNEKIKFAALLDKALALGFDAVATGHYAQVVERADGARELHRAVDMAKDQSYVLGVLDDGPARPLVLPPRRHHQAARSARRPASAGSTSPPSPTATTSASSPTATPGGGCRRAARRAAGRHRRQPTARWSARTRAPTRFTVGPAQGPAPAPAGRGRAAALRRRGAAAVQHRRRRHRGPARRQRDHRRPRALVRPRRRRASSPSAPRCGPTARRSPPRAWADGDQVQVTPRSAVRGVAPGQSVVLYDGTRVVGSATISSAALER